MFENVLVGVGDSDGGADALALARQLISLDGELTLLNVQVVARKPSADSGLLREAQERERTLAALSSLRDEAAVDADVDSVKGLSVARGLHAFARLHRADLLVVGASRGGEMELMFLGDDTLEILRDSPCAVAVAPNGYASRPHRLEEIGVAFDGSDESDRAVALASTLAKDRQARASILQVVPTPVEAVEELARMELSVDLLVLGTHRHRAIERFVGRSTSETLVEHPVRPLLVLPPTDAA